MTDLLQIIVNVTGYLPSLERIFYIISWLIGFLMVVMAIRGSAKRSEMGKSGGEWSTQIWTFVIGISFIALPGLMAMVTQTIFAAETPDASSIFEYAPATVGMMENGGAAQAMIQGITAIVMFIGVIAVMRGLYLMKQSADGGGGGPKTFGPGFTIIISGVLAINFPFFIGMMEQMIVAS